jgi:hypothetical protein
LVKRGRLIEAADYQPFIPRALKTIVNKSISMNPSDRYGSALDMRRALEALSFPGYWTCDATGRPIGYSGGHRFHFEELALPSGLFNFRALKTSGLSRRITNVSAYSDNRLTRAQVDDLKKKFMQFIVTGNP